MSDDSPMVPDVSKKPDDDHPLALRGIVTALWQVIERGIVPLLLISVFSLTFLALLHYDLFKSMSMVLIRKNLQAYVNGDLETGFIVTVLTYVIYGMKLCAMTVVACQILMQSEPDLFDGLDISINSIPSFFGIFLSTEGIIMLFSMVPLMIAAWVIGATVGLDHVLEAKGKDLLVVASVVICCAMVMIVLMVFWYLRWLVALPAMVVENIGFVAALRRSRQLISPYFSKIFWISIGGYIVSQSVSWLLMAAIGRYINNFAAYSVDFVLSEAIDLIFSCLSAVIYFKIIEYNENQYFKI